MFSSVLFFFLFFVLIFFHRQVISKLKRKICQWKFFGLFLLSDTLSICLYIQDISSICLFIHVLINYLFVYFYMFWYIIYLLIYTCSDILSICLFMHVLVYYFFSAFWFFRVFPLFSKVFIFFNSFLYSDNHVHNILILCDSCANFPFTTSETKRDY